MTQLDRRSLIKTAAWSAPVIVVASAVPAHAAASGDLTDVGAYRLIGTCGTPGIQGPGFFLDSGPTEPLPVGTTVLVAVTGVTNAGVWSVSGGTATVTTLSGTTRLITLTAELPAGARMAMRTSLSTTVAFTMNGASQLPADYTATSAKTTGTVNSTFIMCTSN